MQARLDEEAGQFMQLRQNIGQEWAGRAPVGEARHLAQDVQHRIADDARARLPPASSGVGQNLAVKGKYALGPFLSILVIECQHKVLKCESMPMDEQGVNHK
jgi:hypothetical protein